MQDVNTDAVTEEAPAVAIEEPANTKTVEGLDPSAGISFGAAVLIAILISVTSSFATVIAYNHWLAQKVVTVDLKGYLMESRDWYASGKITAEQVTEGLKTIKEQIDKLPANQVVVMGDATLRAPVGFDYKALLKDLAEKNSGASQNKE